MLQFLKVIKKSHFDWIFKIFSCQILGYFNVVFIFLDNTIRTSFGFWKTQKKLLKVKKQRIFWAQLPVLSKRTNKPLSTSTIFSSKSSRESETIPFHFYSWNQVWIVASGISGVIKGWRWSDQLMLRWLTITPSWPFGNLSSNPSWRNTNLTEVS